MPGLIELLVLLIVVGAVLYVVSLLPINATIKQIIYVVAIVILAIYLVRAFLPMAGIG